MRYGTVEALRHIFHWYTWASPPWSPRLKSFSRSQLLVLALITPALLAAEAIGQIAGGFARQEEIVNRLEMELQEQDMAYRQSISQAQSMTERLTLDFGASLRFGLASIDNAQGSSRTLRQYEANMYVVTKFDAGHTFFGNLRFLYNDWNAGDSPDGDGWLYPYGNRYWYELDTRALNMHNTGTPGDLNFNVRVGRQFINWNSGLAFSNDMYALLGTATWGQLSFTGLFGRTARSGLYDFDPSRPEYDSSTDRVYWGIKLAAEIAPEFAPYVSYLVQRDHNNDETVNTIFGPADFQYDSEYLSFGASGTLGPQLTYTLEVVHETGTTLSSPFTLPFTPVPQTNDSIDAWAGVLNLAYAFRNDTNARIDMSLAAGSGDDDRLTSAGTIGGNSPNTTDRSFNSLGYINTGLALAPQIANLMMLRVGGSTAIPIDMKRPNSLRIGADFFFFGKVNTDSPNSISTTDDKWIGWEMDWKLDWRIMTDVNFNLRYGVFFPGDAMPIGLDDVRHFVYGGISYSF